MEQLQTSGTWVKIKIKDKTGWIRRMKLSTKIQFKKIIYKRKTTRKATKKRVRIRTRVAKVAVGVKGLRESQVSKLKENKADFKALAKMETFVVAEETAIQFIQDYIE